MRLLLFGDRVFAGYGPAATEMLAATLRTIRPRWSIVNAGAPDETASDRLARVNDVAGEVVPVNLA